MYSVIDVNECAIANGQCTQTCTNTNGSYACSCDSDYVLATDNFGCAGKNQKKSI